jgi:aspartyl-tRNA(Asn)/glutamyl-tRNA(Gln) amidotransferase subunit B
MLEALVSLDLRILMPAGPRAFSGPDPGKPVPDPEALSSALSLASALGLPILPPFAWNRLSGLPALPPGASLSGLSLLVSSAPVRTDARKAIIGAGEIRIEEYSGRLMRRGGSAAMDWSSLGRPCLLLRTSPASAMGEAAEAFLGGIKDILGVLGALGPGGFDAAIRCNAYVSTTELRADGSPGGQASAPLVKIRNLNSLNFVRKAVNAEIGRQEDIIASGGRVRSESRLWNEAENRSEAFKDRPDSPLPRYLDAGIEPFAPDPALLERAEAEGAGPGGGPLGRLVAGESPSRQLSSVLAAKGGRYRYFRECVALGAEPSSVARFLCQDVARLERREAVALEYSGLSAARLASIVRLLSEGRLTARMAREIVEAAFIEGRDPEALIAERGWKPLSDPAALGAIIDSLVAERPEEAERIRRGEGAPREYFIGLAIKGSGGQADPAVLREVLRQRLPSEAIKLILPDALRAAAAEFSSPRPLRASSWAEPRGTGDFAASWASALRAVASSVQGDSYRGVVACLGGPWAEALAAFIGFSLSESPLPLALVPCAAAAGPEAAGAEAWRADAARAIAFAGSAPSGTASFLDGGTCPFDGPSLAPGAWDADEDIVASLLSRCARETLCLAALPGNMDIVLRMAESQGARNLILEFPGPGLLASPEARSALKPFLGSLRKRGIVAAAAFRRSAQPSSEALSFLADEEVAFAGILDADAMFGRVLAAGLEAEDRDEMRKILSEGGRYGP